MEQTRTKTLRAGDLVDVYEDPYTRQKREGSASLRHRERMGDDGYEFWRVSFLHDHPSESYLRMVHPADIVR